MPWVRLLPAQGMQGGHPLIMVRTDWRAGDGRRRRADPPRALRSCRVPARCSGGRASFAALWDADEPRLARAHPATGRWALRPLQRGRSARSTWRSDGCDRGRIERLMRESKLVRDKWGPWTTCRARSRTRRDAAGSAVDKPGCRSTRSGKGGAGPCARQRTDRLPASKAVVAGSPDICQIAFDEFSRANAHRLAPVATGGRYVDTDYGPQLRGGSNLL